MINEFMSWLENYTDFHYVHHKNEFVESLVIDYENEWLIARFTVWDDWSCVSEIIDVSTEQYKMNQRSIFSTFNKLLMVFQRFSDNLK